MKQLLSYCKYFRKGLSLALLIFIISSDLKAQTVFRMPENRPMHKAVAAPQNYASSGGFKTAATATCPTSPIALAGQDTLGAAITSGHIFACNATPFYIYVPTVSGNIASPCVETEFTNFHTNMATNGTETFYEGGVDIACVGPSTSCAFPIGGGTALNGFPWGVTLSLLDPNLQHDFVFCRAGNITTSTITFLDCWTGAQIASTPASAPFSNANPPNTSTCFTMTIPANTAIGTASYSILPVTAAAALTDFHDGESYVNTALLGVGNYTVNYSFTPPPSSGCGTVTGTFNFSVGPNITAAVNSPSVCAGTTATLTATHTGGTGTTTYSWTPPTGLSATTGSVVTVTNPTVQTTYTVTAMNGGCTASATATVNINATPTVTVNSPSICGGGTATLTANGATTYSWTPPTGLSATTGSVVTVTTTSTTTYTVTGTTTGCSSSATATVSVASSPTITVNSATICVGDSATLTATGATTYTWTPITGLNSSSTGTVKASPASLTVYTVTGNVGTCTVTPGTSTVSVNTLPTVNVNSASFCAGDSATLTATGATSYVWSPSGGLSASIGNPVTAKPTTSTNYTVTGTDGNGCKDTAVAIVSVAATPTVTVTSATVCVGDTAVLTASGATSYTWNPSTTLHINTVGDTAKSGALITTTYSVTGTSGTCSNTQTVTATVIPAVTITVTPNPNPICTGGSSTLTATGATTYTWTTDPTLSTTTGSVTVATPTLSPTSYTVSGSVGTCSAIPGVITVSITPTPTLTVSNDTTICNGSTITLTASGATSYGWANSSGTVISLLASVAVTPTVTQTYYVAGNPTSCLVEDSVKVTVNATPTVTASSNPTAICAAQQTATLTATGATSYTWNPSADLSAATGSVVTTNNTTTSSTNYTVTGTDGNGCTSTGTVSLTVNQPTPVNVPSISICVGSTGTLTASGPGTYSWSPAGTLSSSTGTSVIANPIITTTYNIAGVDGNGCISATTTTVTVNNLPVVTATSGTACVGNTTPLTASGAGTYTWNPGTGLSSSNGTPVNATPTAAGVITYTVSGTDATTGCVNTATASVTANALPNVNAGADQAICKGDSVHLAATGASSYVWTPAAGLTSSTIANPSGKPTTTTSYTVTGTDAATGCSKKDVVVVTTSSVSAAISADPIAGDAPLTVVFTNSSTGATTYTWNYGNNNSQVTTSISAGTQTIYQSQGTYTVTMVAANAAGCQDVTSTVIIVNEGFSISIPNIFTPNGDAINDNFFIKSSGVSTMNILIFDRWGLKMWESNSASGAWDGKNGSKDANDGTYFYIVKVTDTKGISTDYKGNITLIR